MKIMSRQDFFNQYLNESNISKDITIAKDFLSLLNDSSDKKKIEDYFDSKAELKFVTKDNYLFSTIEDFKDLGHIDISWFKMPTDSNGDLEEGESMIQGWFYKDPKFSSRVSTDDEGDESYEDDKHLTNDEEAPGIVAYLNAVLTKTGKIIDKEELGTLKVS